MLGLSNGIEYTVQHTTSAEQHGFSLATELLGKLTNDKEILATVPSLVEDHLKPLQYHRSLP